MDDGDGGFRQTTGVEVSDADDDEARAVLDAGAEHLNRHGTVHGGAIATLVDSAMGAAVEQEDASPVTIEMKVTFLEPAPPGRLTAVARVRRRGSRITIVEADVTDADDEAVAHAIATFTTR